MHYLKRCRVKSFLLAFTIIVLTGEFTLSPQRLQVIQAQSDRILFVSEREGNKDIFIADSDGGNAEALTDSPEEESYPAWGPDRTQIAFTAQSDESFNLYIMNTDGSDKRALTENFGYYNSSPTWSPDGEQIAFVSDRLGGEQIFVVEVDDSEPRAITSSPPASEVVYSAPDWSPDGSKIAFYSNRDGESYQLYTMNVDGSDIEQLTNANDEEVSDPAWSPDGQSIAYVTLSSQTGVAIYIYELAERDSRQVTTISTASDTDSLLLNSVTWSDDGKSLMYILSRETPALFTIDINGQGGRQLPVNDDTILLPVWAAPRKIERQYFQATSSGNNGGIDSGVADTAYRAANGEFVPAGNDRRVAPSDAELLNGGVGLTTRAEMNNGEMQVERFCALVGAQQARLSENSDGWYCTGRSGGKLKKPELSAADFDRICQLTYSNDSAFAIQDGQDTVRAYRWRCYRYNSQLNDYGVKCPNSPPPRLRIGGTARVTPGIANRMRATDSGDSEQLTRIPGGAVVRVIGGPVCGQRGPGTGITYWRVDYLGTKGWTAEGGDDGYGYWMEIWD